MLKKAGASISSIRPACCLSSQSYFPFAADASLVYQFDPGSQTTIQESGVTEALTGSFTWEFEANIGPCIACSPTALSFQSDSVSITLDPDGGPGTSVFFENDPTRCLGYICLSFFGALVNVAGLGRVDDQLEFGFGSFENGGCEGDPFVPSRVFYDGLALIPQSGGSSVATLKFSATLVPVPAPWVMLLSGLPTLFARNRRKTRTAFSYTPAADFFGKHNFVYTVTDGVEPGCLPP